MEFISHDSQLQKHLDTYLSLHRQGRCPLWLLCFSQDDPLQYYFPWRFRDGWDLKRHIEIKHQDLHVHCALCEKVYKRKDKLREHMLKEHTALGDI